MDWKDVLIEKMNRRTFLGETLAGAAGIFMAGNLWADTTPVPLRSEHLVAKADVPNGNRRIYTKALLEDVVAKFKAMPPRTLMGHLGMQSDSIIHLDKASHLITDLNLKSAGSEVGLYLVAEIEVLATPCGVILKQLLATPGVVAFRTAGIGSGNTNEEGVLVLGSNYKFITINAIPAKEAAFIN